MKLLGDEMRAEAPHRRALAGASERVAQLLRDLEDVNISNEGRAQLEQELAEARETAWSEEETLERHRTDVNTRLPSWIKLTK
jgi:post-segregation antitoxin (ccd killing protein)